MRLDLLSALNEERKARRAVVLVTDLRDGNQRLVRAGEIAAELVPSIGFTRCRRGSYHGPGGMEGAFGASAGRGRNHG